MEWNDCVLKRCNCGDATRSCGTDRDSARAEEWTIQLNVLLIIKQYPRSLRTSQRKWESAWTLALRFICVHIDVYLCYVNTLWIILIMRVKKRIDIWFLFSFWPAITTTEITAIAECTVCEHPSGLDVTKAIHLISWLVGSLVTEKHSKTPLPSFPTLKSNYCTSLAMPIWQVPNIILSNCCSTLPLSFQRHALCFTLSCYSSSFFYCSRVTFIISSCILT